MAELLFHPDIELEVKVSYLWYESQADGLGEDFINELENAYDAIEELPDTWPRFQTNFRRFILSKFPFSVIYSTKKTQLYVVAVMHNSRQPDYWLKRT